MRPIITLCILISTLGFACSGGGGGSSSPTGFDRELAFQAEAEFIIRDRSFAASCDTIQCALPGQEGYFYDFISDIEKAGCEYGCMPVEIDNSGEVRYYSTWIVFSRFPDGCFERPGEILVLAEVHQLCHPSF